MTKTIMILAIAATLVAGTLTTATIVTAQSETITACVNDKSQGKDLRIVDSADECRNNETPLEWNIQGIQGDKGDTGDQGPKGDKGDTGADGAPGEGGSQTLIVREPFKTVTVTAGSSKILAVKCNSDEVLSGGGVKANGAGKANARFIDNGSGLDGLTWVGQVIHTGSQGSPSFDLQVIAQCLKLQ